MATLKDLWEGANILQENLATLDRRMMEAEDIARSQARKDKKSFDGAAFRAAFEPDMRELIFESMAAIDGALEIKLGNMCRMYRDYLADSKARKEEADVIAENARVDARHAASLKNFIAYYMAGEGLKSLRAGPYNIAFVNNGGNPPLEFDRDEEHLRFLDLPPAYLTVQSPVPDTAKIMEDLKKGVVIPGVRFAPRGTHLEIE